VREVSSSILGVPQLQNPISSFADSKTTLQQKSNNENIKFYKKHETSIRLKPKGSDSHLKFHKYIHCNKQDEC